MRKGDEKRRTTTQQPVCIYTTENSPLRYFLYTILKFADSTLSTTHNRQEHNSFSKTFGVFLTAAYRSPIHNFGTNRSKIHPGLGLTNKSIRQSLTELLRTSNPQNLGSIYNIFESSIESSIECAEDSIKSRFFSIRPSIAQRGPSTTE